MLDYWKTKVRSDYDQITGLAIVEVRAFSSDDAFLITTTLVSLSEQLINEIARRPQTEAVRVAEAEVARTQDKLKAIRAKMAEYRSTEAVIDPSTSLITSNSLLVQNLRQSIANTSTDLDALVSQKVSADSPTYRALETRLGALRRQLASVEGEISNRGSSTSLAKVAGEYEQLDLDRQFATTSLTGAQATLDAARASLVAQRIFITPYVKPIRPTTATYPRRWLSVLAVAGLSFVVWASLTLIYRAMMEVRY